MVTLPSISRALKTARRAVFAPRDADAGLRLAVTASGCAPWAGLAFCDRCACSGFLFPPQAAVASAAGCSIPVVLYSLQCTIKKKKKAQPLAKLSFLVTRTGIELLSFYKYPLMQYVLTIILSLVWISLKGIFISVWYKVWYSSYKKCGTAPACKNK